MLVAVFAGCSPRTSNVETGNAQQILHVAISAEPRDLDPHLVTAYSDMQVVLAFFEGLTAVDEESSRAVPACAESWTVSPDGLTWTFVIRDGLKWSDGAPLTAPVFRESLARALAPTIASEYAYVLHGIKNAARYNAGEIPDFVGVGVKAPDDRTLVIELEQPSPALASILALPVAYPVPLHVIREHGGIIDRGNRWTRPENIVGNGPLRLTDWRPNQHVTGERNFHFREASTVALNGIAFYPYENAASQEAAFRSGQLHLTSELPLSKIATYRAEQPQFLRIDPFLLTGFLRFNQTHPPFDDVRVRRALGLAIDRQTLAANVLTGGELPAGSLTPPGTGGYTATTSMDYDPEQARALLAAAGYPGGKGLPPIEVISPTREINQRLIEAIQQMWKRELRIDLQIAMQEQRVWLDDETHLHYEVSNARWIGDYVEPYTFLELFLSTSGNNNTGWANARYDDLILRAGAELDETRRFTLYQEAEALLLNEAVIAPIYHGTQPFLMRSEVKGWPPALLGFHRYQRVSLEP